MRISKIDHDSHEVHKLIKNNKKGRTISSSALKEPVKRNELLPSSNFMRNTPKSKRVTSAATRLRISFFRIDYLPDPVHKIPVGLITEKKLPRVWVRTMVWCVDTVTDLPVAFEARSNRFQNLLELLYNDDCHWRDRK